MKHLGNLCDLLGWTVPSVDILTGGSPCQNLSVAGNRKGLAGNESGLFLEQIRLFKEMRDASAASGSLRRPRFFVWENVKGAFSCNGGEDFRRVLEEVVRIAEPDASAFWEWMARRMVAVLKRDGVEHPTMCSLFDGIGGFPLSFQRAGCDPVWASEIEEFPIAVTKRHFPEPSRPVSGEGRSTTRQAAENGYKAPLRAREAVLALNDQGGR